MKPRIINERTQIIDRIQSAKDWPEEERASLDRLGWRGQAMMLNADRRAIEETIAALDPESCSVAEFLAATGYHSHDMLIECDACGESAPTAICLSDDGDEEYGAYKTTLCPACVREAFELLKNSE